MSRTNKNAFIIKARYKVVVGNKHSSTVIIAAITSRVYAKVKLPRHTAMHDRRKEIEKVSFGQFGYRIYYSEWCQNFNKKKIVWGISG